jgi:ubiquinone/menaquinone biosynthesis C-methylase UbiE
MTLVLSCYAAEPAQQHRAADSARRPAGVMSADGADWLERPERDVEDRPDIVLAAMKLKNGDVVADVGAGSGYFSRKLARAVGPKGIVYATDIQPEMLSLLRKNAARDRITNIVPILGTASDPGLPKNTLDWILLVDVYHEFQEPQAMLAKLKQSLKKTGRVALVEYRAEGTTAAHIREEHRMSEEQVLREWLPEGFKLIEIIEALPSQRLFIFEQQPAG